MTDLTDAQRELRDSIILAGRRLVFARWLRDNGRLGADVDDEPDPNGRIPPWRLVAPPPKPPNLTVGSDDNWLMDCCPRRSTTTSRRGSSRRSWRSGTPTSGHPSRSAGSSGYATRCSAGSGPRGRRQRIGCCLRGGFIWPGVSMTACFTIIAQERRCPICVLPESRSAARRGTCWMHVSSLPG